MSKNTEEPAFPQRNTFSPGLTKREWFAGMSTDKDIQEIIDAYPGKTGGGFISRVQARYIHADAMIEASKKKLSTDVDKSGDKDGKS